MTPVTPLRSFRSFDPNGGGGGLGPYMSTNRLGSASNLARRQQATADSAAATAATAAKSSLKVTIDGVRFTVNETVHAATDDEADAGFVDSDESSTWTVTEIDNTTVQREKPPTKRARRPLSTTMSLTHMDANRHTKRRRTVEIENVGTPITKNDRAYELMFAILLGIRYSVSLTTAKPKRPLQPLDFRETNKLYFPSAGTNTTPAHPGRDFEFRDYAPKVFRHLREKFGIDSSDYLVRSTHTLIFLTLLRWKIRSRIHHSLTH